MIGSESAHVTIPDVDLSRRHAVLRTTPRGVEVEDLGSRNGTFVDGVRISGRVRLRGPARLRMGASEFELLPELTSESKAIIGFPGAKIGVAAQLIVALAATTAAAPNTNRFLTIHSRFLRCNNRWPSRASRTLCGLRRICR